MTTVHAVLPSAAETVSKRFLPTTLLDGAKKAIDLLVPIDEIKRSLLESGGVGRFDLQISPATEIHHAIVQAQVGGTAVDSIQHLVLREIDNADVIRINLLVEPSALPDDVLRRKAQAVRRTRHISVRGPMCKLPDKLTIDLTNMQSGDVIRASDIPLPEGVTMLTAPDTVIFTIRMHSFYETW